MSPFRCLRENELMELIRHGHWPNACPADLGAHVKTCSSCSDLVLVMVSLREERETAMPKARLESAGALWWRAQLRRRNAAIEQVARPIFGAQVFALAVALVVAAVMLVWQAGNWREWISGLPHALHFDELLPNLAADFGGMLWIVPVLATIALLSGVVVYLASEKQ